MISFAELLFTTNSLVLTQSERKERVQVNTNFVKTVEKQQFKEYKKECFFYVTVPHRIWFEFYDYFPRANLRTECFCTC